jgi:hypothetical protein
MLTEIERRDAELIDPAGGAAMTSSNFPSLLQSLPIACFASGKRARIRSWDTAVASACFCSLPKIILPLAGVLVGIIGALTGLVAILLHKK